MSGAEEALDTTLVADYEQCRAQRAKCEKELATAVYDALSRSVQVALANNPDAAEALRRDLRTNPNALNDDLVKVCGKRAASSASAEVQQSVRCAAGLAGLVQLGALGAGTEIPHTLYGHLGERSIPEAQLLLQLHQSRPVVDPEVRNEVLAVVLPQSTDGRVTSAGLVVLARTETRDTAETAVKATLARPDLSEIGANALARALVACGRQCYGFVASLAQSTVAAQTQVGRMSIQTMPKAMLRELLANYPDLPLD